MLCYVINTNAFIALFVVQEDTLQNTCSYSTNVPLNNGAQYSARQPRNNTSRIQGSQKNTISSARAPPITDKSLNSSLRRMRINRTGGGLRGNTLSCSPRRSINRKRSSTRTTTKNSALSPTNVDEDENDAKFR